ncbi:MAG: CBS domain-containing protein [Crocinitomicaceae bacterium]|nr:CBS domain-containing protein [Crocinitomicaceae bacterium]
MKISASIYSDKKRPLDEVINDLVEHQVDLLHVDCNDDLSVFDDIKQIRTLCSIPIDLHIITEKPSKYYDLLIENPVEYVTFQYEDLKEPLAIPSEVTGKKGIAVITPTPVAIFEEYPDFDFILIMATIPGQSGGKFDTINFGKIRKFRNLYPQKSIHVDGGVNAEVSFILRNMGATSAVSGSYLFNASSIGHALMNLTQREVESHYQVSDFMIPLDESPVVRASEVSLEKVLKTIDAGRLGFTLIVDESQKLNGLISNADVRKGILRHLDDLTSIEIQSFLNENPTCIDESASVLDMLRLIKQSPFPIMYLPVVNSQGHAKGIVTFVNLIKGEL